MDLNQADKISTQVAMEGEGDFCSSYRQLLALDRVKKDSLHWELVVAAAKVKFYRYRHERCRNKKKIVQIAEKRTKAIQFKNHLVWLIEMKKKRSELGFHGECANVTMFGSPDERGGCCALEIKCGMCLCHVQRSESVFWSLIESTGLCEDCMELDKYEQKKSAPPSTFLRRVTDMANIEEVADLIKKRLTAVENRLEQIEGGFLWNWVRRNEYECLHCKAFTASSEFDSFAMYLRYRAEGVCVDCSHRFDCPA